MAKRTRQDEFDDLRGMAGSGPAVVDGFAVQWKLDRPRTLKGERTRVSPMTPLDLAKDVPFEDALPVRKFTKRYRNQKNTIGWSWFETTRRHVVFESFFEHQVITMLDFDPAVVSVSSQPFWLFWQGLERVHSHAPNIFARYADGTAKVINVRPADRIKPQHAAAFEVMDKACREVGWDYETVTETNTVEWTNIDWLSRCRRPLRRQFIPVAAALLDVCAEPIGFLDAAKAVGDPVFTIPVVGHLLWQHALVCPTLKDRTLRSYTPVHTTGAGGACFEPEELEDIA